jgi:hypothetical protein
LAAVRFDQGHQFGVGCIAAPLVLDLVSARLAISQLTAEGSAE